MLYKNSNFELDFLFNGPVSTQTGPVYRSNRSANWWKPIELASIVWNLNLIGFYQFPVKQTRFTGPEPRWFPLPTARVVRPPRRCHWSRGERGLAAARGGGVTTRRVEVQAVSGGMWMGSVGRARGWKAGFSVPFSYSLRTNRLKILIPLFSSCVWQLGLKEPLKYLQQITHPSS